MSKLIIKQNSLEKAKANFEKQSQRNKQFQIKFERNQNKNGKFVTKVNIVCGKKEYHYNRAGIIHSAVYVSKYRIEGDVPSLTKRINNFEPKSRTGKAFKATAKTTNFMAKNVGKTAINASLATETLGLTSVRLVGKATVTSVQNMMVEKYGQYASDDTNRAIMANTKFIINGTVGVKNHFTSKKKYKLERAKFKLQKAELKEFKKSILKPQFVENKANLEKARKKIKTAKKSYKASRRSNVRKARLDQKKIRFAQQKKELKLERKQQKSKKKFMAKEKRNQWRLQDLSRPTPLVLKPLSTGAKSLTASAYQKALTVDERNDAMKSVNKVGHLAKSAVSGINKSLQKHQKKRDKLQNISGKKQTKLQIKDNKLKKRSSILNQKWKSKRKSQIKSAENAKKTGKVALKAIAIPAKFLATHLVLVLIFIIFVMLILTLFNGTIEAIFGNSGWVMGTYTSQDKFLSQAEEYYTELAYNYNKKILMVGSSDDWKKGLKDLGVDTSEMKDQPDTWIWGNSNQFSYDPVYDFDPFKLWSFLCSYYFNFTNSSDKADKTEAAYWKYDDDEDNGTAKVLKDLFNAEYMFEYLYDNTSRWEELSPYNYWGGGNAETGTYYRCETEAFIYDNEPYKYRFKPIAITNELAKYKDSEGYLCITENYRVLDPNDNYELTGFYIMDNRYYSGTSSPFYFCDNNRFFFMHNGERYDRSFWGWNNIDAWFMISPTDTHIWNNTLNDVCMYGYYEKYFWKTDCRLYYNIKQKKTFDQAIKDKLMSMSNGEERYKMYEMFLGIAEGSETTRGNHQEFYNPLGGSIQDYIDGGKIINGYGYDIQQWNTTHCEVAVDGSTHQAIDIACPSNSRIYAGLDGEVKEINTDKNYIIIRDDGHEYWYDGDGDGKNRDTEIYYYNVNVNPNLKEGDTVKKGDYIGLSLPEKKCEDLSNSSVADYYIHIKVEIDSDGWGWDFVDPRLIFE